MITKVAQAVAVLTGLRALLEVHLYHLNLLLLRVSQTGVGPTQAQEIQAQTASLAERRKI